MQDDVREFCSNDQNQCLRHLLLKALEYSEATTSLLLRMQTTV